MCIYVWKQGGTGYFLKNVFCAADFVNITFFSVIVLFSVNLRTFTEAADNK